MTTTLTAATLTVTLTEAVSLNGYDQGSKNTLTIASVNEVNKRIVTVPTSEIEVVAISTANASGTFIEGDVRYIRITNLDDTNHVTLTFKNENAIKEAGKLRLEGKDYIVQDGDIVHFRFKNLLSVYTKTLLSLGLTD